MSSGRSRQFLLGVVAACLVIIAVAGGVTAAQGVFVFDETRQQPVAVPPTTVRIERGDLRDVVAGEARSEPGFRLTVTASGVVTRAGSAAGQELKSGDLIGVVGERPVFLLSGSVPAFRDLKPGDVGRDVQALQAALVALDYDINPSERRRTSFGWTTSKAVFDFYTNKGFSPVDSGGSPRNAAQVNTTGVPQRELVLTPQAPLTPLTQCGAPGAKVAGTICMLVGSPFNTKVDLPQAEADRVPPQAAVLQDDKIVGTLGSQVVEALATSEASTEPAERDGESTNGSSQEASFTLDRADDLAPGDDVRGEVEILIAEATDVLLVDSVAVRGNRDQAWLETVDGTRVNVTVGLCVAGRCEVAGAEEGAEVVAGATPTVPR